MKENEERRLAVLLRELKKDGVIYNDADFARRIDTARSYISEVKSGKRAISKRFVKVVTDSFAQVNPEWLLDGVGDMYVSEEKGTTEVEIGAYHIMQVPFVPIAAQAGYLTGYCDSVYLEDMKRLPVLVDKEYHGDYRIFEVSGNSMNDESADSLLEGDKVLARIVAFDLWKDSRLYTHKWRVWIFVTREDGVLIKEIREHNPQEGYVILHSRNPEYRDKRIELSDVVEILNVVSIVNRPIR